MEINLIFVSIGIGFIIANLATGLAHKKPDSLVNAIVSGIGILLIIVGTFVTFD